MDNPVFLNYKIEDRSYVSFVKREIHNMLVAAGFSAQKTGEIDIIIAEVTSNLLKFAQQGELLYRLSADEPGVFFEVYCLDNGKGIRNLAQMIRDGASSTNTLGQGLGAIDRLSDNSGIYTLHEWGTVVYSRVYKEKMMPFAGKKDFDLGVVQVCYPGEKLCGDGYTVKKVRNGYQFFMADGLGHGSFAHEAAQLAIEVFKECREESPAEVLRYIHQNVKKSRGLVGTVACLNTNAQRWLLCGVGNIATSIYTGVSSKNYTPYNGILGHNIPRTMNDSILTLEKYQTLIMYSDGLRTRWDINDFPGLLKYDPIMISAALYKDNARYTDDMSILVAKINL